MAPAGTSAALASDCTEAPGDAWLCGVSLGKGAGGRHCTGGRGNCCSTGRVVTGTAAASGGASGGGAKRIDGWPTSATRSDGALPNRLNGIGIDPSSPIKIAMATTCTHTDAASDNDRRCLRVPLVGWPVIGIASVIMDWKSNASP